MDLEEKQFAVNIERIIGILGVFITVIGSINAFFLKGIYSEISEVKIQMVQIATESKAKELRIVRLESKFDNMEKQVNDLSREVLFCKERLHGK